MTTRLLFAFMLALSLGLLPSGAVAFGGGSLGPAKSKPAPTAAEANYAKGVAAIDKKDWNRAVFYFFKVVESEPKNADAENWLGYSYRQLKDLDNAFAHYGRALAIDPGHKGAHEYIGEAYLQTGDLTRAERHLSSLRQLCRRGCEELDELKEAVAKFKARS